jgi:hypothetical protein
MLEFRFLIECTGTLLKFSTYSTRHLSPFFTFERVTSHLTYLYQKDERALPGDLRNRKFTSVFPFNVVSHNSPCTLRLQSVYLL